MVRTTDALRASVANAAARLRVARRAPPTERTRTQGLEAGIHRQFVFTGLRLGCYSHILHAVSGGKDRSDAGMGSRIVSALATSALGISLANPAGAQGTSISA
jgi:hypothetical protein